MNFIEVDSYILFKPKALYRFLVMHRKLEIKKNSFMRVILDDVLKYYFFPFSFVFWDYLIYYSEEYESYEEYLRMHFNLLDSEVKQIKSYFLMFTWKCPTENFHSITNARRLSEKIFNFIEGNEKNEN